MLDQIRLKVPVFPEKIIRKSPKKSLIAAEGNFFGSSHPLRRYILDDRDLVERIRQLIGDDPVYKTSR